MDVRCEKCASEYELEDARVPATGLSVKCSTCGNVFRVFPVALSGRRDTGEAWMVRQQSGNVFQFKELTTLQRWIVERKVSRSDEISKTGKSWKRLGDIAELATFFQVVEAPPAAPQPLTQQQLMPQPSTPQPMAPQPMPMQPMAPQPMPMQPMAPQPMPMQSMAPQPMPMQSMAPQPAASGTWNMGEMPAAANTGYGMRGTGGVPDGFDDLYPPRRGGKGKWVVLLLLLVVGGGGGALYVLRPQLVHSWIDRFTGGGVSQLAVSQVNTAYADLYKDTDKGIAAAASNFEKAFTLAPKYADAKAGWAEAELARAENVQQQITAAKKAAAAKKDATAKAAKKKRGAAADDAKDGSSKAAGAAASAPKLDLGAAQREVDERSQHAFELAKDAIVLDPTGLRSNLAMADYYRFEGDSAKMKALIAQAKKAAPDDPGIAYVLGSSFATDPSSAALAIQYFDAALEKAPDMNRARYKLAEVYAAQGDAADKDKAVLQLKTLLKKEPDHARAKALLNRLQPPPPPKPAPEPVTKAQPPQPPTYDELLDQADRLRQDDRSDEAMALYQRVTNMEPDNPEGLTGMGYCYIDLDNTDAAIASFQRALNSSSEFTDAIMGMATAYQAKGMKRDAVKYYRKYLDLLPNGPDAPVARHMLQQMKQ